MTKTNVGGYSSWTLCNYSYYLSDLEDTCAHVLADVPPGTDYTEDSVLESLRLGILGRIRPLCSVMVDIDRHPTDTSLWKMEINTTGDTVIRTFFYITLDAGKVILTRGDVLVSTSNLDEERLA